MPSATSAFSFSFGIETQRDTAHYFQSDACEIIAESRVKQVFHRIYSLGEISRKEVGLMGMGIPLGQGRTADVFAWGENEIVKLFKQGYPAALIENESHICQKVCELGLPVPAFSGCVEIEGRSGLVFERVKGEIIGRLVADNPANLAKYAKMMSELHFAIHKHTVPELPFFCARMAAALKEHKTLVPEEKVSLLDELYRRADGYTLCHGDFHPYNILVSARGPVIMDWGNAGRGNQTADAGITSYGFKKGKVPHYEPKKAVLESCRLELRQVYLDEYLRLSSLAQDEIFLWEEYLNRFIKLIDN